MDHFLFNSILNPHHLWITYYLIPSSPFPPAQFQFKKMHMDYYHGLLNFHSDDIFVDIIAFIFAGDAVVNILPQIVFAATRRREAQRQQSTFTAAGSQGERSQP